MWLTDRDLEKEARKAYKIFDKHPYKQARLAHGQAERHRRDNPLDPRFENDIQRKQHNALSYDDDGTQSWYGPKGDGPGSWQKTGHRYLEFEDSNDKTLRKEVGIYNWRPDAPEQKQAPSQVSDPKPEPEPEPYKPSEPSQAMRDARSNYDQYKDRFKDTSVKLDTALGGIASAAAYGNAASDDYQRRFLPSLKAQADLEAHEVGKSGRDAIARYEGEPSDYDDPKDLFGFYSDKINSALD